jgi:hypothetical protein
LLSGRTALVGAALGVALLISFFWRAGLPLWAAALSFVIYFAIALACTRMRAELGPPAHDLHRAGPDTMLPTLFGPNQFTRSDLTMFSLFYGFNRAYRAQPMPIMLEGFKMSEQVGSGFRPLFWAMLLAVAAGSLAGFWANIDQGYRYGAAARIAPPNVMMIFGGEPWNRMNGWLSAVPNAAEQYHNSVAVGVGFGATLLLNALRLRLAWFPFHPVGYAISSSWSLSLLWMPLFVAWLVKLLLLRYGGLKAYRQALPFFLGMILGECILGSLWTLVGIGLDIPTYSFWP